MKLLVDIFEIVDRKKNWREQYCSLKIGSDNFYFRKIMINTEKDIKKTF